MSSRYINECNLILRNLSLEIRSRCPYEDQYCCYLHCCFINRRQREIWETWYFWFGVALVGLLMFTSAASFLVGVCTRKQRQRQRRHGQLVRVQNLPASAATSASNSSAGPGSPGPGGGDADTSDSCSTSTRIAVTTISGPGGIIQPRVIGGPAAMAAMARKAHGPGTGGSPGTSTAYFGSEEGEGEVRVGPLDPAYPPVQPVTIVRGSAPGAGAAARAPAFAFRQTDAYTELVLPPGYVDADPLPSQKQPFAWTQMTNG